jgi:hypothetical protein
MSYLIYVNELGPNYKGDNIYEFIFSDTLDEIWENLGNPNHLMDTQVLQV